MGKTADIQTCIMAAWRLMTGRSDGLRMLDLSADGFWNSFFAIVVSLPALMLGWVVLARELSATGNVPLSRFAIVLRLAVVDMGAWILPLVALALVARGTGLAERYVAYVVASNWGSVIVIWIMLPQALIRLFLPDSADFAAILSLALFAFTMVLSWRLTTTVIGKGTAVGSAIFAGMFFASLATLFMLQSMLGIAGPA